jgi:hypothetical protein
VIALLHQSSIKYVELIPDQQMVYVKISVAPADVVDAPVPHARWVRDWISITGCTPGEAHEAPDIDGRFIAVTWQVQCPAVPEEIDVDLSAFFAADRQHEAIVRTPHTKPIVIRADAPRWTIPVGKPGIWRGWWLLIPGILVGVIVGFFLVRHLRRPM